MLSNGAQNAASVADAKRQNHQYPTRHGSMGQEETPDNKPYMGNAQRALRGSNGAAATSGYARGSPAKKDQRHVVFQLIDPKDPRIQARLPMRVMISPNDTTESIITTVKNFYGLYEYGVSFETRDGFSIIASFDNFENDMVVYVRTVAPPTASFEERIRDSVSPKKHALGAPFEMRPSSHSANHSPSRSAIRSAGVRSMSPQSETGRRSASAAPGGRPRSQRTTSKDVTMMNGDGYSSGDNASVTSSRRSKAEEIKAEITVDNIVEGGRRKRAFESSVSMTDSLCRNMTNTSRPGTATVRSTSGANECVDIVDLSSAPQWTCWLALCVIQPADLLILAGTPFAAELRSWQWLHAASIPIQPLPKWLPTS